MPRSIKLLLSKLCCKHSRTAAQAQVPLVPSGFCYGLMSRPAPEVPPGCSGVGPGHQDGGLHLSGESQASVPLHKSLLRTSLQRGLRGGRSQTPLDLPAGLWAKGAAHLIVLNKGTFTGPGAQHFNIFWGNTMHPISEGVLVYFG